MASLQSVSDDEIVSNLTREKADLTQQVVQLSEEVKRATQASEKAEAALTKKASETKSLAMRIAILETVLEAANVELPRPMPVEKKGSGKMMTMLQNATSAKAKEDGGHDGDAQRTSPSGRSAIKPSSNASSSRASPNVGSRSLANRSPGSFTRGSPSVGSPGRGRSRPRSPTLSLVASEPDSSAGANPNAALNPSSSRRTAPKDVIGGGDSASSTWPGAIHVGGSGGGDESVARVFATDDTHGSGSIEATKLRNALIDLGVGADALGIAADEWGARVDSLFARLNMDSSGTIELHEVSRLAEELRSELRIEAPNGLVASASHAPRSSELVELVQQLYETQEALVRNHTVDEPAVRFEAPPVPNVSTRTQNPSPRATPPPQDPSQVLVEMAALEDELHVMSRAHIEQRAACVSALARGRWARALAFTSMQAQAQARLGSTVKWAVAIAAARNADLRAKAHSSESKAALEHAKRHARLAGEERELLGNRVEALSEQHDLLVEEHSSLRETADHQAHRLEWLEQRLHASADYVEGHAERSTKVANERCARLESELSKVRWQLQQAEEGRGKAQAALRQASDVQHSLGASHAALDEQHTANVARLQRSEAEVQRLEIALRAEVDISNERMASLIKERRRARFQAQETAQLRHELAQLRHAIRGGRVGHDPSARRFGDPSVPRGAQRPVVGMEPAQVRELLEHLSDDRLPRRATNAHAPARMLPPLGGPSQPPRRLNSSCSQPAGLASEAGRATARDETSATEEMGTSDHPNLSRRAHNKASVRVQLELPAKEA